MPRSGELLDTLRIERRTGDRGDSGERADTWTEVETVAAAIRPLRAQEAMDGGQPADVNTVLIEIRYGPDVQARDRLVDVRSAETYQVVGVTDWRHRHVWLELLCQRLG